MPEKREIRSGELSGVEILTAIQERYDHDDLPPMVWKVLEADARAKIVEESPGSYADPWGQRVDVEPPF